jgi:iron complex outermembrane receptor protein
MRISPLLSLLVFSSATLFAAGGSIVGKVTGKDEKESLVGVNVFLQGSVRGASTNYEGSFRIADVTPGTYTLVFSIVGYQRETRSGIVIEEGKETVVNVAMTVAPVQADQVVVTANKREQSLQEVPVSISVMDAAEIRYRNAQTIEDAVRYIPGVNITGGQVNIRGSSGYSRGAGSRIMMLVDGIPFIAGDTGELIFEAIPVGQIARIEVVKGASSALYGSSALGGVVNVITKPIPEFPETYIRTYGGLYGKPSFENWNWSPRNRFFSGVSVGQTLRFEDFGIAFSLSRQVDDGFRQNDFRKRYNFYLKAKEDFASENFLTLSAGLLSQGGGQFVWWKSLDSALVPGFLQRDDAVESTRYFVSGSYNDALSESFLLSLKGIWNHNRWASTTWHEPRPPGFPTRWTDVKESSSDDFRLEGGATMIWDENNTLTFGMNGQFFTVSSHDSLFGKHSGWSGALYAQDEWKPTEQLSITLGARMDVQAVGLAESDPQINPKLAVAYNPFEGTRVRASYGKGFRIPSVAEVFVNLDLGFGVTVINPDLRPEHSESYEIGLTQQIDPIGTIDLAAFRSDYTNLIEPTPYEGTTTPIEIQWQNTPKARMQGVETSIKLGFFDQDLIFSLGYTYVYAEDRSPRKFGKVVDSLLNPQPNNILPYRPRHLFVSGLQWQVGIVRLGVDFRYISRVDRIFDLFTLESFQKTVIPNADQRSEIIVTDFRLGADFTSLGVPLSATLNINNAFRYNYLELTANMSPPRNFVLVLEARL